VTMRRGDLRAHLELRVRILRRQLEYAERPRDPFAIPERAVALREEIERLELAIAEAEPPDPGDQLRLVFHDIGDCGGVQHELRGRIGRCD